MKRSFKVQCSFKGTNEHALIDIIANRSNIQRQQIKLQYKTMYGVVRITSID